MRLLILTQYFLPEIGAPQTRLWAMASELKKLGHEVEIVTGMPNYPKGKVFEGYRWTFLRTETRNGMTVRRVWVYAALGGGLRRVLNYLSFMFTSVLGLLLSKKPDYLFVESPPLLLSFPAFLFSRIWGIPFILNVADLWPDSVIEKGFLDRGLLTRALVALERWSYKKAVCVNAMTEGMKKTLLEEKGLPPEKVLFLPNGVDTVLYRPRPADLDLKKRLGLAGKDIILYAGTQGYAHGLEHVFRAAKILEDRPNIHFLFLGSGSVRARLEELHAELALKNVTFLDPMPLDQLPPYLSVAQCGLSSLRDLPLFNGARPAKVFPILASGKPLIFVGRGEGANLIANANAGIVVPPADPEALVRAVIKLIENPSMAVELGENGRRFVEENLQWTKLVGQWLEGLTQLPSRHPVTPQPAKS